MDTTYGSTATGGSEIQLSITRNYAGHWETWEGVREMVQNWHDGLYSIPPNVHISDDELKFKKVRDPATLHRHKHPVDSTLIRYCKFPQHNFCIKCRLI